MFNLKKALIWTIPILLIITSIAIYIFSKPVTALHINSETIRLESDMSKEVSITVTPQNASSFKYNLVSEDEFVAVCENNTVRAVNEGETYIYAESYNKKVQSNRIKVIVSNDIFEIAAIAIDALNNATADAEFANAEITPEKLSQITEGKVSDVPAAISAMTIDVNATDDTVYVTKSGSKYHLSDCSHAKNASPIPRSDAIQKGKTPCKTCNP